MLNSAPSVSKLMGPTVVFQTLLSAEFVVQLKLAAVPRAGSTGQLVRGEQVRLVCAKAEEERAKATSAFCRKLRISAVVV